MAILTEILEILVGGFTTFATGIGGGLNSFAESIFVTVGEGGAAELTTFGTLIIVFSSISLCIGISRWVLNFVTSLGARNR